MRDVSHCQLSAGFVPAAVLVMAGGQGHPECGWLSLPSEAIGDGQCG